MATADGERSEGNSAKIGTGSRGRKKYSSPQLNVYGTLTQVTGSGTGEEHHDQLGKGSSHREE
jgi:hypothetical protein